jgi:hypothetical protein
MLSSVLYIIKMHTFKYGRKTCTKSFVDRKATTCIDRSISVRTTIIATESSSFHRCFSTLLVSPWSLLPSCLPKTECLLLLRIPCTMVHRSTTEVMLNSLIALAILLPAILRRWRCRAMVRCILECNLHSSNTIEFILITRIIIRIVIERGLECILIPTIIPS